MERAYGHSIRESRDRNFEFRNRSSTYKLVKLEKLELGYVRGEPLA